MATIVTRASKGSALTHTEMDANFNNLNTDKPDVIGTPATNNVATFDANDDVQDGGYSFPNANAAINASDEELNFSVGVTSAIQTQLDTKYGVGGTDVPITDGGTGASTASGARTNLGLGNLAVLNSVAAGQIDANAVRMSEIYTTIGTYASPNVSPGAVWSAPEDGIYFLKTTSPSIFEHQVLFNGVWTFTGEYVSNTTPNQFLIISSSVRIKNTSGSTVALSYQRVLG